MPELIGLFGFLESVSNIALRGNTGFRMTFTATPTAARTITFPNATDTVALLNLAQTLDNKTLTNASISITTLTDVTLAGTIAGTPIIVSAWTWSTAQNFPTLTSIGTNIVFSAAGLTAPRTFTFPDVTDTLVTLTATQSLSAKTLSSPTFLGTPVSQSDFFVGQITDAGARQLRIRTGNATIDALPYLSFFRSGAIEAIFALANGNELHYAINPAGYTSAQIVAASKFKLEQNGKATFSGDVSIGVNSFLTTNNLIREVDGSHIGVRNSADNAYAGLYVGDLQATAGGTLAGTFAGTPTISGSWVWSAAQTFPTNLILKQAGAADPAIPAGGIIIASSTLDVPRIYLVQNNTGPIRKTIYVDSSNNFNIANAADASAILTLDNSGNFLTNLVISKASALLNLQTPDATTEPNLRLSQTSAAWDVYLTSTTGNFSIAVNGGQAALRLIRSGLNISETQIVNGHLTFGGSGQHLRFESTGVSYLTGTTTQLNGFVNSQQVFQWATTGSSILTSLTINPGTSPTQGLFLNIAAIGAPGTRDSHYIQWRGTSDDGVAHTIDWYGFIDVTTNAGVSSLVLQSRVDAASATTRLALSDAGVLTLGTNLVLSPSGLGGVRTFTFPDATTTLVGIDTAQTLTNKIISGGTFASTIAGTPTFSGAITFGAHIVLSVISDPGSSEGRMFLETIDANNTGLYIYIKKNNAVQKVLLA